MVSPKKLSQPEIYSMKTQKKKFAPYLFCLDYELRTSIDLMKDNGFTLEKAISKRNPAQNIPDADYTDDIALLTNTPAQAESLLHVV